MNTKLVIYDYSIDSGSCLFHRVKSQLILDWFIELLKRISFKEVILCTEEVDRVREFIKEKLGPESGIQIVNSISPPPDAIVLKVNYIYDKRRLIRLIKKGNYNLSSAVLWKIKNKDDIKNAEETLDRLELYPIARYTNLKLGKRLANSIVKYSIQPNQLTFISLVAGSVASFCLSTPGYAFHILGALLIQLHCTLDFADGHLARLRNISSKFGAFWDGVTNKTVESLCYVGISYGLFLKYSNKFFFLIGLLVILGHFMIPYVNFLKENYLKSATTPLNQSNIKKPLFKTLKKIYWFFEQWDVRLYIISFFAILNKLEIALVYFAIDFNARWIFNVGKVIFCHSKQNFYGDRS